MWSPKRRNLRKDIFESKSGTVHCAAFYLKLLRMRFIRLSKSFQFYDSGFVPYPPRNDLLRMFLVIRFDDCPAAVLAIMAAPFEMMQIPCGVNLLDNCLAVFRLVR